MHRLNGERVYVRRWWMMKFCGILLIVVTGLGMGLLYARRLRSRVVYLSRVERLLEALSDRLLYFAQPLSALWQSMAKDAVLVDYPLVQDTASALCKGENFYTAFSFAVDKAVKQGHLLPLEAALLTELGGSLGHSGLASQGECIHQCLVRLEQERLSAQEVVAVRARVYPMLGLTGGVCLALLLM